MINCQQVEDILYAAEAFPPGDEGAREHLAGCGACARLATELTANDLDLVRAFTPSPATGASWQGVVTRATTASRAGAGVGAAGARRLVVGLALGAVVLLPGILSLVYDRAAIRVQALHAQVQARQRAWPQHSGAARGAAPASIPENPFVVLDPAGGETPAEFVANPFEDPFEEPFETENPFRQEVEP